MQSNQLNLGTRWRFQASADALFAFLNHPLAFPDWWGAFFLRAETLEKGDEQGIDRLIRFRTKSLVGKELVWGYRTLAVVAGRRIDLRISGDFLGDAQWLLEEDGIYTDVIFEWNVTAEKTFLKDFLGLRKSAIKTNHRWGMEQGRIALEKELAQAGRAGNSVGIQELLLLNDAPLDASAVDASAVVPQEKAKGHSAGL